MSRVFLDVGAHEGQTLEEVTRDYYGFDQIFSYEPMPEQFARLTDLYGSNPRVTLCNYGLLDVTDSAPVYGTNERMEASVYSDKADADAGVVTICDFRQASVALGEVVELDDTAIMKLNCEGAEVRILADLISSGAIHLLDEILIDFDIRKVLGRESDAADTIANLASIGFDRYVLSEQVMVGHTHQERTANWLQKWRLK